jgi:hypothetical protein
MAKKRNLESRMKRMKRPARLKSAKSWIPTLPGKNIIKKYRDKYAVDCLCAIKELQILGVKLDPEYITQLKISVINAAESKKRGEEKLLEDSCPNESDEYFAYIAGYTEGGVPYGITWEEWELKDCELDGSKLQDPESEELDLEAYIKAYLEESKLEESDFDLCEFDDSELPF